MPARVPDGADITKVDEIPYDFTRKRLSVVVRGADPQPDQDVIITKGALANVLDVCAHVRIDAQSLPFTDDVRAQIQQQTDAANAQGYRILGVATRAVPPQPRYTRTDETDMTFVGYLLFLDPPKEGARATLADLADLGVQVKVITGDSKLVTLHMASILGLPPDNVLTGAELADMRDEALWHVVDQASLFTEVDPNQKERIILALKKRGHVVGYMGDGINDAPPLHAADVGISVNTAVDVAKEAADVVLLQKDLSVLHQGILLGRTTFANTLKYVFITTSANFGNMFSVAGASLFLPFLPLLPMQILLTNFLTDLPAMTIAGDHVDPEQVTAPRRWNIRMIRNFMLVFGLVSTVFDYVTFLMLLLVLHATVDQFRTGWFLESVLSELLILLVILRGGPFYRSRPVTHTLHRDHDGDALHLDSSLFALAPVDGIDAAASHNGAAGRRHRHGLCSRVGTGQALFLPRAHACLILGTTEKAPQKTGRDRH
ncbi:MAG: HAD-IC family P-type ATPase [Caldilineaceae bacterium]